jgi:hypothetical protein
MTDRTRAQPLAGSPPPSGPGLGEAFVEALARRVVELIRSGEPERLKALVESGVANT